MATPDTCVFDLPIPRRPGLDDTGGGAKQDDQEYPPDPETMLTANDANQWSHLHVRMGAVIPVAILSVHFTGGTPSVELMTSVKDSSFTIADLTVTDNGIGDVSITWPAGTFPARTANHEAVIAGAVAGFATASTIAHGARVYTAGTGGAAADLSFNLHIYGD